MQEIYYKNSNGQIVNLLGDKYKMQAADLFASKWSYDLISSKGNNRINDYYKSAVTKKIKIGVVGASVQECYELIDLFNNISEVDVLSSKLGKLYIGEYYLDCSITAAELSEWEYGINVVDMDIELTAPNPTWKRETLLEISSLSQIPDTTYHNYPFNYPFNYPIANMSAQYVTNDSGKESNFRLEIYGLVGAPSAKINGNNYGFSISQIYNGEYVVIDSLEKTITKHLINGEIVNIFNQRAAMETTFKKIPIGSSLVEANCNIALTIYEERSAPKWTL